MRGTKKENHVEHCWRGFTYWVLIVNIY